MAVKNNKNKNSGRKRETAESMAQKQREISVSEFFLKNRHLLGFDSPRKALLTAVKEAVDNALDACEDAGILPEVSVDIKQKAATRFIVTVTDNGPGIVKAQIPKIFGKLLYGSKFHRLRMSRGQQGIGISAAGMYGQLTTGNSTIIRSKTRSQKLAHQMGVQLDTRKNKPAILNDEQIEWLPTFTHQAKEGKEPVIKSYKHGTSVAIEMEASYIRGRLSVDEYVKQCAIVNPHLNIHYRIWLSKTFNEETEPQEGPPWISYLRVIKDVPEPAKEIMPHPHGVELGLLMKMLKDSTARNVRSALSQDFSRVSSKTALDICERAGISPKARTTTIAHRESEALYKAIQETKLMRPPTDCLSPIGEEQLIAGLKKEIDADFYTSVTRKPAVYRGNPFQIEVGLAYAKAGANQYLSADDPVRVMRFANRVPLLYMSGACAITRAVSAVKWRSYGLAQPKSSLPVGPMLITVHMASVWVPFTSESKEAIAHYPEIIKEITFCLQECGRRLSVFLNKRKRLAEAERKKNYMEEYIPHMALGLKEILDLSDKQEKKIVTSLHDMLERTHLQV